MWALVSGLTSENSSLWPFDVDDPHFPVVLLIAVILAWVFRIRVKDDRDDE